MNAFVHAGSLAALVLIALVPAAGERSIAPAPRACHLPLEAVTAPSCITERAVPPRGS